MILVAAFAYAVGTQAFADEEEYFEQLEKRAARSRERRLERQRDLASRLAPVEQAFGWSLVDANGLPTSKAYAFLGAAVLAQLAIAAALAAPLRDAFSLG